MLRANLRRTPLLSIIGLVTLACASLDCGSTDEPASPSSDASASDADASNRDGDTNADAGHEDATQPPPDVSTDSDDGGADVAREAAETGTLVEAATESGALEASAESGSDVAAADAEPDVSTDSTVIDVSAEADAAASVDAGLGCDSASYPPGPYGFAVGSVIANLSFTGKVHTSPGSALKDEPVATVCLGRHRSDPAVKVLVIDGAAVWCAPSVAETQNVLVPLMSANPQNGGHLALLQGLLEGPTGGVPATMPQLNAWATKYQVPFDMALDADRLIAKYMPPVDDDSGTVPFPMNLVVRTDTMQITYAAVGASSNDLEKAINDVLLSSLDGALVRIATGAPCAKSQQCLGQAPP